MWSGRSTYLRRGKPTGEKAPRTELGEQAGPVAQVRVPGDIGRRYGAVSGDRNPIHLHSLTARAFGFKSAIAHGMWLKARTLATLEGRLPDSLHRRRRVQAAGAAAVDDRDRGGAGRRRVDARRAQRARRQAAPGRLGRLSSATGAGR